MKDKVISVKRITLYAIGIALFVAVGCVLPLPIPNTTAHVDLGYMVMAVFAYLLGPVAGAIIGGMGRFIEDMILYGSIGSPGWLIASICMGLFIGLTFSRTKKIPNQKLALVIQVALILVINAVFLIGLSPFVSSLWHGVPYVAKLPSGISAFLTNCIAIIVLGLPVAKILERLLKHQLEDLDK